MKWLLQFAAEECSLLFPGNGQRSKSRPSFMARPSLQVSAQNNSLENDTNTYWGTDPQLTCSFSSTVQYVLMSTKFVFLLRVSRDEDTPFRHFVCTMLFSASAIHDIHLLYTTFHVALWDNESSKMANPLQYIVHYVGRSEWYGTYKPLVSLA